MKKTSSILLSISLLSLSLIPNNGYCYGVNEAKSDAKVAIKTAGTIALAAGKTAIGVAALYFAVAGPLLAINDLQNTSAITVSANFTKHQINERCIEVPYQIREINLLPAMSIGLGIASAASAVLGVLSLKSAWDDVQKLLCK